MSTSSSAPKRRKLNKPEMPSSFGSNWTVLPSAESSIPFHVCMIVMGEDSTCYEYRALFMSELAAKRLWLFSQTVQRAESGAGCVFLANLANDTSHIMKRINNKNTGKIPSAWFWADCLAELVKEGKLEIPEWDPVGSVEQCDNLDCEWEDVVPAEKIDSIWRVVSWI